MNFTSSSLANVTELILSNLSESASTYLQLQCAAAILFTAASLISGVVIPLFMLIPLAPKKPLLKLYSFNASTALHYPTASVEPLSSPPIRITLKPAVARLLACATALVTYVALFSFI